MTPIQKMQQIVEAAGDCWHEHGGPFNLDGTLLNCAKCKKPYHRSDNPSPGDMKQLFVLAKIVELNVSVCQLRKTTVTVWSETQAWVATADDPAEALLEALHQGVSEAA